MVRKNANCETVAMKIYLLTHERETHRKTNTGSLALKLAGGLVERVLWERVSLILNWWNCLREKGRFSCIQKVIRK